jgi:hypothetical protein
VTAHKLIRNKLLKTKTDKMGRASFEVTKQYLAGQHLAPLLHASSQQLHTLNKWSTAGQALKVGLYVLVSLVMYRCCCQPPWIPQARNKLW